MPIAWADEMKVGNREIDSDHRELISIVNEFEAAAARTSGEVDERAMRIILGRLQAYTQDHFAREEYLQATTNYDGYEENKRQHTALRKTLAEFIEKYDAGGFPDMKDSTAQMIEFLNHWLVDHILKIDLKMRGQLSTEIWR